MKKKVNGRTVEVGNIEVFEKAAEGMAINRTVNSVISDIAGLDMKLVEECVTLYTAFYKSLPFPLYALDTDVKYATIGMFIQHRSKYDYKMWVSNGLYICIDEEKKIALNFVNATWGFVKLDKIPDSNIDLASFEKECGYTDLKWALDTVKNKQSTSSYYREFMEEFIKACNNQPMVLKWELSNILDFGRAPDKVSYPTNRILNLDTLDEYMLDIYVTGVKESKEQRVVWSFFGEDDEDVTRKKYIKQYGVDVYIKEFSGNDTKPKPNSDKLRKVELFGAVSIFNTLYAIRSTNDANYFEDFTAFISGETLVYAVNNRIFVAKANKYVEPKEIARGVEMYSYDRNMIYFAKIVNLGKGIRKETVYSYSLKDGNLRLCKIQFVNK